MFRKSVAGKILRGSNVPVMLYNPDAMTLDNGHAERETAATVPYRTTTNRR